MEMNLHWQGLEDGCNVGLLGLVFGSLFTMRVKGEGIVGCIKVFATYITKMTKPKLHILYASTTECQWFYV